MNPKISIIIPVYNAATYLCNCLNSLQIQTLKEIEIICIDDGSNDQSIQIIEDYQKEDKRIILLKQEHQFAGVARNMGIRVARGQYLAFLDADDMYVDTEALETMFAYALQNHWQVCAGLRSNMKDDMLIPDDLYRKQLSGRNWMEVSYKEYQDSYHFHNYIYSSKLVREKNIRFLIYQTYEDPLFLARCLNEVPYYGVVAKELYCYRLHFEKQRWERERIGGLIQAIKENFQYAMEHNLSSLYKNTCRHLICDHTEPLLRYFALEEESALQLFGEIDQIIDEKLLGREWKGMASELAEEAAEGQQRLNLQHWDWEIWKSNVTKILEKDERMLELYRKWSILKAKGILLSDVLKHKGILQVGIYGYGKLGQSLYQELTQNGIEVISVFDQKADFANKDGGMILSPKFYRNDIPLIFTIMNYKEVISELQIREEQCFRLESLIDDLYRCLIEV